MQKVKSQYCKASNLNALPLQVNSAFDMLWLIVMAV